MTTEKLVEGRGGTYKVDPVTGYLVPLVVGYSIAVEWEGPRDQQPLTQRIADASLETARTMLTEAGLDHYLPSLTHNVIANYTLIEPTIRWDGTR